MVLATFTHYVRNLFGGGGETGEVKEAPHEVRKGDSAVAEVTASKPDDALRPVVATKKIPGTAGVNSDEGPPSAEESTDESGTEEAAAVAGTSPDSSSPTKRKRANKKTPTKASNDEDSVRSGNAKTAGDAGEPLSASSATVGATAPPTTDASAAASASDAAKAVLDGATTSRGSKRPRREAPRAKS